MRKMLFAFCAFFTMCVFAKSDYAVEDKESSKDEFLELSEPYKNISGAYYGAGLGLSRVSHSVKASKDGASEINLKKSANQFDISAIAGFGAAFYKKYYAGIEMEFFKRFKGNGDNAGEVGIVHSSTIGLNMDVRFGYLFPEKGYLVYGTVGFARVLGSVAFYKEGMARPAGLRSNGSNQNVEGSFGSFYPTFGIGIEHKINHAWNVRGDFRLSITSKDGEKNIGAGNASWKYEAKPNRVAFRISITRSI